MTMSLYKAKMLRSQKYPGLLLREIYVLVALSISSVFLLACPKQTTTKPDASQVIAREAMWSLEQPFPDVANLNGVWGYDPEDLWAVGSSGTILHYDGVSWKKHQSPTSADLFAIDGHETMTDGDKDIYAVGSSGTIIHWDGTSWTLEADIPDTRLSSLPAVRDNLMGVWHGRNLGIFVVGEKGTILVKEPDPNDANAPWTWRVMLDELVQDRMAVCETRVAYDGDGYPYANGATCAPCMLAPPDGDASLPQSLWMCSGSGTVQVPFCQGPDYSAVDCEVPSTMRRGADPQCSFGQRCEADGVTPMYQVTYFPVDLKAVVGFGSGDNLRVIAVGESGAIVELRPNGARGSGAAWNCEGATPSSAPAFCWRPVARAGDTQNPAVRDTLAAVWGTSGGNVYAAGEDGRLLWRHDDDEWVRGSDPTQAQWLRDFLTPPTPVFLRDLWHQGRNDFFAVGFSGIVMHHTEGEWRVEEVPTHAHIRAIWGKTRNDLDAGVRDAEAPALRSVIAVGAQGIILRRSLSR